LEPVFCADDEVFLGVFLRDDFTVIQLQNRDAVVGLRRRDFLGIARIEIFSSALGPSGFTLVARVPWSVQRQHLIWRDCRGSTPRALGFDKY